MALTFPNIDPIAFSVGPFDIRWYALAYLAGFLLGLYYIKFLVKKFYVDMPDAKGRQLSVNAIEDFLPWAIIGVILGGRIGYILFYQFAMYMQNPAAIFRIWEGGMSFHGGAAGMIVAMILYAWKHKLPLLQLTDVVCCAVPIGLFFGRVANFINGELYGRVTTSPLGIVFPYGGSEPRHASQLYEAFLEGLILFIVLLVCVTRPNIRRHAGMVSGVFLMGYAASRFIVEYVREPDAHLGLIGDFLSMGQILCIPMFIGGLICVFVSRKQAHVHNS
jgi:phosphatidylglycerol:prolipoprotein diacylglycerol transferase